ncbi:hypothetical protein B9Z19DRAFT_1064879 [Tuber borchii]|uniref:t-SNARE coiled-coil homology domain-containing protein n=1 Tax=Tuber borchii TaxID=42251 RepID=A0A2T6ZT13_TUBBO|nr:hypothetical protein B9Z19DRAFT_1064879 [Tuber borchii]
MTWENFSHHNTQYLNRFAAVEKNATGLHGAIGALGDSLKKLESKVDKGFEKIDTRFNKMEEKMDTRFNNMETKLRDDIKGIDTRFNNMETKLRDDIKGIDTRISTMEDRLRDDIKGMEDRLTTRLTNMEAKFTEEFKNGRAEMKELNAGQKKRDGMMMVGLQAIILPVVALFGKLSYDMFYQEDRKKT